MWGEIVYYIFKGFATIETTVETWLDSAIGFKKSFEKNEMSIFIFLLQKNIWDALSFRQL